MLNYYDLPFYVKIALTSLAFVTMCVAISLLPLLYKRRKVVTMALISVCVVASGIITTFYATLAQALQWSFIVPKAVDDFCKFPIWATSLSLFVCIVYITFIIVQEMRQSKKRLSTDAIKESLDKLPTGLCFYKDNGRVILINAVMDELSHKIFGEDLQNAMLFLENLKGKDLGNGYIRLSAGDTPTIKLPDGMAWSFAHTKLKDMHQLVAVDVTELSKINAELAMRNEELVDMNARLRKYGESVDELTRTRERIETKANIHRELGQALLITRRYILDETGKVEPPVDIWKKNVAVLKSEAEYKGEQNPYELFMQASESAGVKVELKGTLPKSKEELHLFVTAGVECLVNGVRHANASTLFIEIMESEKETSVHYTNDGDSPTGEITEGGGLSSLRYSTKRLGGTMLVNSYPKYELIITVPKRSER